jgi:hypothetical protein
MVPAPIALGLTLCESIIIAEGTRRVSSINGFNRMQASSFPYDASPFYALATLTGGQGEAEITLVITHLETDEEVYSLLERAFFPDRFAEVRITLPLPDVTFPEPGHYLFTLLVDDDWIAHRRVRVI